MEPVTIALIGSALLGGLVAWKTLFPSGGGADVGSLQAQDGADKLIQINGEATRVQQQGAAESEAVKSQGVKTAVTSLGAGAMTGATMAASTTASISTAAVTAGITAGIGIAIGIAVMLWAKHEARIKGAKTENAGWNAIAAAWKETIQGIILAFNQKKITVPQAVAELKTLRALMMADAERFNHMPGVDWAGGGERGTSTQVYYSVKCDKHCTIGCCLYNGVIGPATNNAIALVQGLPVFYAGQNKLVSAKSFNVPTVKSTKYGFNGMSGFTLAVR